jgi:pyrroline-5-carboxylate reductase
MRYAFLGAGKMAMALIQGMLRANLCSASEITVSSRSRPGLENLVAASGTRAAASNAGAVEESRHRFACVKPSDALRALEEAGEALEGRLLLSVVTGLKIAALREAAAGSRVIRAMPNTAAMVGRSATAVASEKGAAREDVETAERVFGAVGEVFSVAEEQLDAVTGLSGSGPAFVDLVMEVPSDGGSLPDSRSVSIWPADAGRRGRNGDSDEEHPALREMVAGPAGPRCGACRPRAMRVRSAFLNAVKAAAASRRNSLEIKCGFLA